MVRGLGGPIAPHCYDEIALRIIFGSYLRRGGGNRHREGSLLKLRVVQLVYLVFHFVQQREHCNAQ